jgi:hypothetical protein
VLRVNRLRQGQAEVVAEALGHVPDRLQPLVECDVFCGDPIFAGIWRPEWQMETTADGRNYRGLACVGFPYHARDKRLTLVLPVVESVYVVLHELGHVLQHALLERVDRWDAMPAIFPVTEYGNTNYYEAFAEAFAAWFYTPRERDEDPYWPWAYRRDNDEFFDRLMLA